MTKQHPAIAQQTTNFWQIGLDAFNNDPTQPALAMQNIWDAMLPPGNLNLCARIVGALFGDHYFNGIQMNVALLAQELQAALGKNQGDCQLAAQQAFAQWCGLSVRASFGDNAQIPRTGNLYASPDVIVNGLSPTTPLRLINMWDQSDWGPVEGKDYTYGRAASVNLGVPISKPQLRMYVTNAGLNNPPNQWTQLLTFPPNPVRTSPMQNASGLTTLAPGDRAASSNALLWDTDGSGHYCVIATASTEFFTNDPSTIPPGNWSSWLWIQCNGAAGWHNVDVPRAASTALKIYNQDGTPERFEIEAHCSGLPAGTEVSLESADPALVGSLRSGPITITAKEHVVATDAVLPAHYKGDLKVHFKTPHGGLLPPNASIEIRMYWQLSTSHRHYQDAVRLLGDVTAIAAARPVRIPVGAFTFVGRV